MTTIHRFLAAALLVALFAVVLGLTIANNLVIGGAAQKTPHLSLISEELKHQIILGDFASSSSRDSRKSDIITVDLPDKWHNTTLHRAAWNGDAKTALSLVKEGGSVMVVNVIGATPLDVAIIKHGKDSVIALVLQRAMEKEASNNRRKAEELLREWE